MATPQVKIAEKSSPTKITHAATAPNPITNINPNLDTNPNPHLTSNSNSNSNGTSTTTGSIAIDAPTPHHGRTSFAGDNSSSSATAGGVYYGRTLTRIATDARSIALSQGGGGGGGGAGDEDNEGGGGGGGDWRRSDGKKQEFRGKTLFCPLYVFSSTFSSTPTRNEIIQVLSLIIWSLTLIVTVKYVFIILRADNEGEGGTFSCYSLLTRYANLTRRDPREEVTVRMQRHNTLDVRPTTRNLRAAIENSPITRALLKAIGVLAVSMVMADGVLTPAQSVLGAIQGLSVVSPGISTSAIVGATCGILILLFTLQPLGTSRIAYLFAPVVIAWLGLNAGFGIYNLATRDWTVLKAFSPSFAIQFFVEHGTDGWKMLGGVLLAFTGVEALFADLGAFSRRAVQMSWLMWTYPCLLLTYSGQAAHLALEPAKYTNPFFNTAPRGTLYPGLILAILAAIVASQAIITATFQLISQIMKLSYCPQVKVVHTSAIYHGQLYVPFLNWLLMLGTILVTAVYNNTTSLGHAYGVCVIFVTFFDTLMVTLVAILVWRLPVWIVCLPALTFATLDGLYLSSALNKVPDGAWFTLLLSALLAGLFLLWRFGKENQWRAEAGDRFHPRKLLQVSGGGQDGSLMLTPRWGSQHVSTVDGFGIFFDKTGVLTPSVFTHFISKLGAVPAVAIFFHLHPVETPSVADDDRYHVSRFPAVPGCYRLVVRHGYMDEVITPDLGALVHDQVRRFVARPSGALKPAVASNVVGDAAGDAAGEPPVDPGATDDTPQAPVATAEEADSSLTPDRRAAELTRLDAAYAQKVLYIVGKGQMRVRPDTNLVRRLLLHTFLWIRENTRGKVANLRLTMERIIEVGFVKGI